MKISRFDIFWVELDPTRGSEIKKTRPCVVVSPDVMNDRLKTVLVVPLTSTIMPWPFRPTIVIHGKRSSVACDHVRSVSKDRFGSRIGSLEATDRENIINILQEIFAL